MPLGAPVHALAASADGRWALAAHAERLSLVDAGGEVVRTYDGTDLERRRRGSAQALMALSRRRSFVACWPALGEWWEISLDPEAAPIFDGLVHDYRMKEGIGTPGYLGVRRAPLGLPTPSMQFADPRVSWVAGTLGDAVAVVHLDVRRRIALLPIAGARPEASLLRSEGATMSWWLPAGDTLHVKNKPVFLWNLVDLKRVRWEGPELTPGKHTLEFDFRYAGLGPATMAFGSYAGIGQGGTGVLKVDGKDVATEKMEHTLPFILQWDESLDIGSDTGTPVNDADYQAPFKFTGKIDKITLTIDRPKLSPEDIKKLEEAVRTKKAGD